MIILSYDHNIICSYYHMIVLSNGKSLLWVGPVRDSIHESICLSSLSIQLQIECLMWGTPGISTYDHNIICSYCHMIVLSNGKSLLWVGPVRDPIHESICLSSLSIHLQIECLMWGTAGISTLLSTTHRESLLWRGGLGY